jgi:hypothetical protein
MLSENSIELIPVDRHSAHELPRELRDGLTRRFPFVEHGERILPGEVGLEEDVEGDAAGEMSSRHRRYFSRSM